MRWFRVALACLLACVLFVWTSAARAADDVELTIGSWTFVGPDGHETPLTLPAHLDRALPRAPVDYVLRARVMLPPSMRGRPLTLGFPELRALAELEVDGVPATQLDVRTFDTYRTTGAARWRIPAQGSDRPIDLELTIHHRWQESGWLDAVPVLTTSPFGSRHLVAIDTFNRTAATIALATGALVGLLYAFLWLSTRGPRKRVCGLFAVGAGAGMTYPAFLLGLTQPIFGIYESQVVGASVLIGAVSAIYFAHAYFQLPEPHRGWKLWVGVALLVTGTASDPFHAVAFLGPLLVITSTANTIVQLVVLMKLGARAPKPRNMYLVVLAWPATAFLGFPDFHAWLGRGELLGGARTACLGMAIAAISQALALLRDHVRFNERADELNAELARRVEAVESKHREVELLNDELRRQIAARTRQLAVSLADTHAVLENIELAPGAVVEERYVVVRLIGQGGMGAVYEVERCLDKKHLALKTLTGVAMGDPFARARFAREAEIAANVKHPNVVALVDFDIAKEGYLFLVMELVDGSTLHEVRRRTHDVPWTLYVLAQVAAGLDAIHAQGIVHRDLKPANVLLSRGRDGRRPLVKITDFGVSSLLAEEGRSSFRLLAATPSDEDELPSVDAISEVFFDLDDAPTCELPVRARDDAPTRMEVQVPSSGPELKDPKAELTKTGAIFGTPNYMAAELTRGTKTATRAADVFSLGVIAFELLTFRRPFEDCPVRLRLGGRPLPVPPRLKDVVPTLPNHVAELLDRALSHAPSDRPTAHELANALREAYGSLDNVATQR